MAGKGERFRQQFDSVPKPLILWNGRALFSWALESVKNIKNKKVYLVTCAEDGLRELTTHAPEAEVISLSSRTNGPAESALLALEQVNAEGPVIFCDCDLICNSNSWDQFIQSSWGDTAAVLLSFYAEELKHSFVKTDSSGLAIAIAEKEKISTQAVAGVYGFRDRDVFLQAARDLDFKEKEKYISHVYQNLIVENKKIKTFSVDELRLLGTPEDIENARAYLE